MNYYYWLALLGLSFYSSFSQQMADTLFMLPDLDPEYVMDSGPIVGIDEGHFNFHTKDGRYKPFTKVLESDGYRVVSYSSDFSASSLSNIDILVISNALHHSNSQNWKLPNPSAFTKEEIVNLERWVREGGSLFLIADHMPLAGAAEDLASAFNYTFLNGFAVDTTHNGSDLFYKKNNTLVDSEITNEKHSSYNIDSIITFTGQAFQIPDEATPILRFSKNYISYQTEVPFKFDESATIINVGGWYQGAFQKYGKGKLVVFGEAAMFTAQISRRNDREVRFGMNRADAKHNAKLLLNIMHWLD